MTAADTPVGTRLLEVDGAVVEFKVRNRGRRERMRAVDDVTFGIDRGEVVGLVGESGSGKSTLARATLGLIPLHSGHVRLNGLDLGELRAADLRKQRRHMQMVFQDPFSSLDPSSLIGDSIEEPLRVHTDLSATARHDRAKELLELVGLPPTSTSRYPREFSGGQRQRIAIARAVSVNPALIVCDEAVSALDVSTQNQVINLLSDLQERLGLAYLFIGHDLAVVREICQRVLVMYLGQIIEQGPVERVMVEPGHPYTAALLSAIPATTPRAARERERVVVRGDAPTAKAPETGCRFEPRCPFAMEICRTERPPAFPMADGGYANCHLHTHGPTLAGQSVLSLGSTRQGL